MNINTGLNSYNTNFVNNTVNSAKMSQSQSLTGSVTDSLKEGEVFEGSVNSIENGKVTIGLANGQTMTARLDAGVSITPGQSIFFEVKSNDGNLVQIRPVSLNALDANPTLLKALDMANLAATERTINMVNSMMQNSMSVSPENLAAMNRAMINNPDVDIQTLVTMTKHGMELTPDNVNMFQNYASDKAILTDNFDTISEMLPELMASDELSSTDVISINNAIKEIFVSGQPATMEGVPVEGANTAAQQAVTETVEENFNVAPQAAVEANEPSAQAQRIGQEAPILEGEALIVKDGDATAVPKENLTQLDGLAENISMPSAASTQVTPETTGPQNIAPSAEATGADVALLEVVDSENGAHLINSLSTEKQIDSFNVVLNNLPDFPKDNLEIFSEDGSLRADADVKQVFREITEYLNNHPDIPKETLNDIVREPLYKNLLKNIITSSFAMEPKDVTKPGEISKLYERVLKQTEALERLVSSFNNKAADAIKNQTNEIKQNVNFMNSANEMYNFVQIPLKMYNQNTDSMLYVKQNKKSSYEAGEEITAFLHFDMEYLGSTDVFISLKEANVACKWNLASEESMKLIENNLDILTERLAAKGFSMSASVTCNEPRASFVEDFLGEPPVSADKPTDGMVHRYSFDMRA
ncbi:flagellar hook-length control protein FliK [Pseudobutyrivibrio sp. MD2005]|uniref:flagellar hook-length control protein FliK n=1 Tax=Pseudobutyrivibrio sp. MD2005 TaxID=1410616 RepID=UPI0004880D5A|nr:flagellar hook-length control protein FliK [Pseudobutyrivibrio sp. MD2005]